MLRPAREREGAPPVSYPVQARSPITGGLVDAELRSASRSGYWMVFASNPAEAQTRYVGPLSLPCPVALAGPMTAYEAAVRFPQHAGAINDHPDSTD